MTDHERYAPFMEVCEALAIQAAKLGNAPVGCLIIKGNKIVAEAIEAGHSKQDITCHAEIEAIRMARKKLGKDLSDCELVTTHEPCLMCGYAIRFHKINKVIYKEAVPYLGSITSDMAMLTTLEVPPHWGNPPEIYQLKGQES